MTLHMRTKTKKINAILIDPSEQSVRTIEIENNLQEIRKAIKCDLITIVKIQVGNLSLDMILDDEGLLKNTETQQFFKYGIESQLFAGRALITSYNNRTGDTASIPAKDMEKTLEEVFAKVLWVGKAVSKTDLEELLEVKFIAL